MHSKNVQAAITHLFDAYNDKDIELAMAGYGDDLVFITNTNGRTLRGVPAVREMFSKSFVASPTMKALIDEIYDAGDTVVFKFTMDGVNGQTGKAVRFPCLDVVKFNAKGEIIYEDNYSGKFEEEPATAEPASAGA